MSDASVVPSLPDREEWPVVLGFVVLVNLVGASPALVSSPDSAWFQALNKPALYPPTWAFGVVWTVLFTMLGVALFLVWRRRSDPSVPDRDVQVALGAFVVQMVANVAWTPTFFTLQDLGLALAVIVALDALIVAAIVAFDRVDRRAAALLVPYLAWALFATLLNYQFLTLNG